LVAVQVGLVRIGGVATVVAVVAEAVGVGVRLLRV
jgi:hypothetical protein